MAALTIDAPAATGPGPHGPVPAQTAGPAAADRSAAGARPGRTVRSWPLLVLAAPAAAEVWSGWVGIAQKTGFGLVSPLPGIWSSLHLDTAVTLPVGVEAYAAYALRAWLARDRSVSGRTRRFVKWSAIFSFALGMAGQVAYHLLAQAGMARAPWAITTVVSCLPVLVLGMGTCLAHMLRADADARDTPDGQAGPSAIRRSLAWPAQDQAGDRWRPDPAGDRSAGQDQKGSASRPPDPGITRPVLRPARSQIDQARAVARELATTGRTVSRRALRRAGVRASNEVLNGLARMINAELAGTDDGSNRAGQRGQPGGR